MKILFLGTPAFAVPSLKALATAYQPNQLTVVTKPDQRRGRGQKVTPAPVKELATELGLTVWQPNSVNEHSFIERVKDYQPDLIAVVAFGQILSREFIALPRICTINIHASLLPAYRGASPVQAAILNGDQTTGVTCQKVAYALDAGDIILQKTLTIGPQETTAELMPRLSQLGGVTLLETIKLLATDRATFTPQDPALVSHVGLLTKEDGLIDWNAPATKILNQVRGLQPWPMARTNINGKKIQLIKVRASSIQAQISPGTVGAIIKGTGILVGTGDLPIIIEELKVTGKKVTAGTSFANGYQLQVGNQLG